MNKKDLILLGAASVTGALTGLGLSFTALSPLVIGGIVAAVPAILVAAYCMHDVAKEGEFSKARLFFLTCFCVASAAIGVGLAAAATYYFSWCNAWCSFSRCNNSSNCANYSVSCNGKYYSTNS